MENVRIRIDSEREYDYVQKICFNANIGWSHSCEKFAFQKYSKGISQMYIFDKELFECGYMCEDCDIPNCITRSIETILSFDRFMITYLDFLDKKTIQNVKDHLDKLEVNIENK